MFYPVDAAAVPEHEAIETQLRRGMRALFLIQYFGLAMPTAALLAMARRHGAAVIEDCAHALYALDELGRDIATGSDLAVFSLPKTSRRRTAAWRCWAAAAHPNLRARSARHRCAFAAPGGSLGDELTDVVRRIPAICAAPSGEPSKPQGYEAG